MRCSPAATPSAMLQGHRERLSGQHRDDRRRRHRPHCHGRSIVNNSETKGIGSKVIDNEATSAGTGALDQFVGKSGAGTLVVKQNIDAVTGATVSTKGVTKGVNAALAAAEAMN